MWQSVTVIPSSFLRTCGLVGMGLLLTAQALLAQPAPQEGSGNPTGRRGFGVLGGVSVEPSLSRELRNETFAAQMKMTDEQQKQLADNDMLRREYFRTQFSVQRAAPGVPASAEFLAKLKEFDAKAVDILTAEQKVLWEARKAAIKEESAARTPTSPSDRERIIALEAEVKLLKEEIAKLKAAIAAPAAKP